MLDKVKDFFTLKYSKMKVVKFEAELTGEDGQTYIIKGDLQIDTPIFIKSTDGTEIPCQSGEYTMTTGDTIVVKEGKISDIKTPTQVVDVPDQTKMKSIKLGGITAKDVTRPMWNCSIFFDGETLAVGSSVFYNIELDAPLSDGEYDGGEIGIIIVKDAKVSEIKKATDVLEQTEKNKDMKMEDVKQAAGLPAPEVKTEEKPTEPDYKKLYEDLDKRIKALEDLINGNVKQSELKFSHIDDILSKVSGGQPTIVKHEIVNDMKLSNHLQAEMDFLKNKNKK